VSRWAWASAVFGALLGAVAVWATLPLGGALTWAALAAAALVSGGLAGWLVQRAFGTRLTTLVRFVEGQVEERDGLRRLPPLGDDEVGRAARALNRILAAQTDVRVSMIDQRMELDRTTRELELAAELAKKSHELEQRLGERRLLFDLLRASTEKAGMDEGLPSVCERLAVALRLRELAILVRQEDEDRFVVRAAHGFEKPSDVVGRSIRRGEGISGEVVDAREPIVVPDVTVEPEYLAFWGAAPREGAFAAVPIREGERTLGILAMTRPANDPLLEPETRFLSAVADTIALAIRHAQLVDELRELSTHDELTGLANRRLLDVRLRMEVERSRRFGTPLTVLAIDIDHFKRLNDTYGHAAGDTVLASVAATLERGVRRVDVVARVGGEEFVVVLAKTDLEAAAGVAEKIRTRVAVTDVPGFEKKPRVTISVGVAELLEAEEPEDLLARADEALYAAKSAGRDRIEVALDARRSSVPLPPANVVH
jgi:diguanylate cyclase (GGDEF)-like protein